MSSRADVVCVTGAAGFIGSHVVKELLGRGYIVYGSVRRLGPERTYPHLQRLDGAATRLHLFTADLMQAGSFDDIIARCDGVFHTASPFFFRSGNDPQREFIQPAVDGTLNVLRACAKSSRVKRVVLTSSMASIMAHERAVDPSHVFTENDWSNVEMLEGLKQYYAMSKTMAERAAWDFMQECSRSFTLVTVNPTMVIGPMLQSGLNQSNETIFKLVNGARKQIPSMAMSFVDVRDVARAHVFLYENHECKGRHINVAVSGDYVDVARILSRHYPDYPIPSDVKGGTRTPASKIDNSKLQRHGFQYMTLEASLLDTVESLKEHGHLKIPSPCARL